MEIKIQVEKIRVVTYETNIFLINKKIDFSTKININESSFCFKINV